MGSKRGIAIVAVVVALAGASAAFGAEIYRCESDGIIEFSDTPCQADPEPYRSAAKVSVVGAPGDLEQTARLNQAFIEQRLEDQAEFRRDRLAADAAAREQQQTTPPPAPQVYLPLRYRAVPYHKRYPVYSFPGHKPPLVPETQRQPQPFSALSGPFPGTRRPGRDP
ncbi:MAG: hypothetical protein V2J10_11975 [Wenzhouxiangella sp.]|jgi:hypothetical protein|nr:hypothetical protein [Wenzhouxiangella sp.]